MSVLFPFSYLLCLKELAMTDRRRFLQQSSLLIGGSTLASALSNPAFAIFKNKIAPSDQLRVGAIGINGMGWANVNAALKVPGVSRKKSRHDRRHGSP